MDFKEVYKRYFIIVLFILLIYLAFLLIKPFLIAIFTSFLLAYMLYPVYKWLNKVIRNGNIASALMLILVLVIIFLPMFFITKSLVSESSIILVKMDTVNWGFIDKYINADYVQSVSTKVVSFVIEGVSSFLLSVPFILLNILVMLFIMFFLFKSGDEIYGNISHYIPLNKKIKDKIVKEFRNTSKALVYGVIFVSILQGLFAGFGFYVLNLFGLTNIGAPFFLGVLTIIVAMIPFLGPTVVWVPVAIYELYIGDFTGAIILAIYCFVVLNLIFDGIVKNKFISDKTKIHPILVFLGIIGGISAFGFMGLFIGPVILGILRVVFESYFSS